MIKEEISSHKSGGDAFVTCLDGESIVMPIGLPYAVYGKEQFKMLLVVIFYWLLWWNIIIAFFYVKIGL